MASVIHGFFYNKKIFSELGLTCRRPGRLLRGARQGEGGWSLCAARERLEAGFASELGFQNIGPNYWKGGWSAGADRGQERSTTRNTSRCSRSWPLRYLEGREPRLCHHQRAVHLGKAAFYAAGSWEIAPFTGKVDFGVMRRPWQNRGMAASLPITPTSVWG
jgi:raffinose/stachyose/melibiose transport system substrate-binding protein